jgi:hypothetical protein
MIAQAQYEAAKSQHGDISGFSAVPILMQAVISYKAPELDALAARYATDIPGFVSFSQTVTAKDHFAAMAAAQTVTVPLLTAEIEEFTKTVEARHMAQWQQAYQEQVQKPARASTAADAARRAARPMPRVGTNFKECPDPTSKMSTSATAKVPYTGFKFLPLQSENSKSRERSFLLSRERRDTAESKVIGRNRLSSTRKAIILSSTSMPWMRMPM